VDRRPVELIGSLKLMELFGDASDREQVSACRLHTDYGSRIPDAQKRFRDDIFRHRRIAAQNTEQIDKLLGRGSGIAL